MLQTISKRVSYSMLIGIIGKIQDSGAKYKYADAVTEFIRT